MTRNCRPRCKTPANVTLADASSRMRARQFAKANPKSVALQNPRSASHLPGGNTRTTLFHGPFPLRFVKGEGYRLTDADGHSYVNFISEYTAGMFGHSHPVIRRAIERRSTSASTLAATPNSKPNSPKL